MCRATPFGPSPPTHHRLVISPHARSTSPSRQASDSGTPPALPPRGASAVGRPAAPLPTASVADDSPPPLPAKKMDMPEDRPPARPMKTLPSAASVGESQTRILLPSDGDTPASGSHQRITDFFSEAGLEELAPMFLQGGVRRSHAPLSCEHSGLLAEHAPLPLIHSSTLPHAYPAPQTHPTSMTALSTIPRLRKVT